MSIFSSLTTMTLSSPPPLDSTACPASPSARHIPKACFATSLLLLLASEVRSRQVRRLRGYVFGAVAGGGVGGGYDAKNRCREPSGLLLGAAGTTVRGGPLLRGNKVLGGEPGTVVRGGRVRCGDGLGTVRHALEAEQDVAARAGGGQFGRRRHRRLPTLGRI